MTKNIFAFISVLLIVHSCSNQPLEKQTYSKLYEKTYPTFEYHMMKQYPNEVYPLEIQKSTFQKILKNTSHKRSSGFWNIQGPANLGGRVNSIAIHPTNKENILLGFSEGGIWETTDGGNQWKPIFDNQITLSIADIAFDPIDPNIIYVATGDPNISGYPSIGNGIYKSIDGGSTWIHLGLEEQSILSKIQIAPSNTNILYVGAMGLPFEKNQNRGLYKSIDGGDQWEQILFVSDSAGITDLVVHPNNPNIVYAAAWNRIRNNKQSLVSGHDAKIFKTLDGGSSWSEIEGGLPKGNFSRTGITMSHNNPNILYALYIDSTFNIHNVYKTIDGGSSWSELEKGEGFDDNIFRGFGWYFGQIRVNPLNDDDVFILGVEMLRTQDNGVTWENPVPSWFTYQVHADEHDMVFRDSSIYLATDGGAYRTDNNTETWIDIENIPATQYYRVAYNPHNSEWYYGGAQDNGTSGGNMDSIESWPRIFGGDGFDLAFNDFFPDVFYVETQNGRLSYTFDGGTSFNYGGDGINLSEPTNWDMPYLWSHHDPYIMYAGTDRVYQNVNAEFPAWIPISGVLTDSLSGAFSKNISAIHESPVTPDIVIAGTSDGQVWVTSDKGTNWENISEGIRNSYISDVQASSYDPNIVYATVTAYKDNNFTPFIYRSNDLGKTWVNIQGDLPQIPINDLFILPNYQDRIMFAATDVGVYYTKNFGENWQRVGQNMPIIPVYEIDYNNVKNEIFAATFARGIQSFDLSQIPLIESSANDDALLFELKVSPQAIEIYSNQNILGGQILLSKTSGHLMFKNRIHETREIIDHSNIATGIYILSVIKDNKISSKKIFIP